MLTMRDRFWCWWYGFCSIHLVRKFRNECHACYLQNIKAIADKVKVLREKYNVD